MHRPIQGPEHRTSSEPALGSTSLPPHCSFQAPHFQFFRTLFLFFMMVPSPRQHHPSSPDTKNPPTSGSPSPNKSQLRWFSKHKVCRPGLSCPALAVPYCLLTAEISKLCSYMQPRPHLLKQTPPPPQPHSKQTPKDGLSSPVDPFLPLECPLSPV